MFMTKTLAPCEAEAAGMSESDVALLVQDGASNPF